MFANLQTNEMIAVEFYQDSTYKTKKGYPIKFRIYSGDRKYKLAKFKKYTESSTLVYDSELIKRQALLIDEVKYINDNKLAIDEAIRIINNGIPIFRH